MDYEYKEKAAQVFSKAPKYGCSCTERASLLQGGDGRCLPSYGDVGFHPCPPHLQAGQLGAVLEQLLDGDVAHVELGGQGVLLLHLLCQLLKHVCNDSPGSVHPALRCHGLREL